MRIVHFSAIFSRFLLQAVLLVRASAASTTGAPQPGVFRQTNSFEFIAGLVPTDPVSRFSLRIEPVPDQPSSKNLIFGPIVEGRVYDVKYNESLNSPWLTLPFSSASDAGLQRTVTDDQATSDRKFYHVEISKP